MQKTPDKNVLCCSFLAHQIKIHTLEAPRREMLSAGVTFPNLRSPRATFFVVLTQVREKYI